MDSSPVVNRVCWGSVIPILLNLTIPLTEQLPIADAALVETATANPVVQRLATAPGVGPLIATAFVRVRLRRPGPLEDRVHYKEIETFIA